MQSEAVVDAGLVRLEFTTEGKNSFTALDEHICEADKGGTCVVEISTADLQAGWNEIEVGTRRRTGDGGPLIARFFLGEEAFQRRCEVTESGGPEADTLVYELKCEFDEGFSGLLFGLPLEGGRASVPASQVPLKGLPEDAGVTRPLVVADLPLEVVNRAGAVMSRPLRVVLPLPLVQLSVEGWQDPWYEPELPLRIRAEAGAEILVDGEPVLPTRDGAEFVHVVRSDPGSNEVVVEARREGRHPSRVELRFVSKSPDTPLYLEQPARAEFTTDEPGLRLRGATLPEAKLYLAGRRVDLARDGSFDIVVVLDEGDNDIDLLAVVDPAPGVRQRPPTRRELKVHLEPDAQEASRSQLAGADPTAMSKVMGELATDPWRHQGAQVRFPFRIEAASTSLARDGCVARLEGVACTHEVSRKVRVGFEVRGARACDGEELHAVVELDSCPDVVEGQRVDVVGRVLGGLGGRVGEWTVERPRIAGSQVLPSPFLEPQGGTP